jgi:hypothetical protein
MLIRLPAVVALIVCGFLAAPPANGEQALSPRCQLSKSHP